MTSTLKKSRINANPVTPLFSLGELCVSNFIPLDDDKAYPREELSLYLDETSGLVQLGKSTDFDLMYKQYWYNSGTNDSMIKELADIVSSISRVVNINKGDKWLDIGCNDGTLLSMTPYSAVRVGCDPSSSATKALTHVNHLVKDYFSAESTGLYGRFKVITAIAMFYDLEDPLAFLRDIETSLDDDGLFVMQMSYLPLMLKQLAFDNICHEHLCYYSLEVIKELYDVAGLVIRDVSVNDTNGGSFRVYAQKKSSNKDSFGTAPYRDVCEFRINSMLEYERSLDLKNPQIYKDFYYNILSLKHITKDFILKEVQRGKRIYGYGASTKGNTLLQYYGLDDTMITAIAERQSMKYGLKTVGSNIPIISENEMRMANPDYLLILPWHFVYEFKQRESVYLKNGGQFIVPCPYFDVIN